MGLWVNMFFLPLDSDKTGTGFCLYACDISPVPDTKQQASLSANTATGALDISIKLGSANKENYVQVFDEVIETIRQECDAEHSGIILYNPDANEYTKFCEASRPDSSLPSADFYETPDFQNLAAGFDETIHGSSCVIIKDENDMKWLGSVNPDLFAFLGKYSVKSVLIFPLKHKDKKLGYLWSLNFNTEEVVRIKEVLELSTYFISAEISNFILMKQLEYMSMIDMLTGCRNRNAMNNAINDIVDGKVHLSDPYAVIFADLNSLKKTNDERGHNAGDKLLRRASALLTRVFSDCEVYRAGGDEFMIIVDGVSEDDIKGRLAEINNCPDIHFAFGYCFVNNGEDIRQALRTADERMYSDKLRYYEQHPENKYR
jgi:diguanylate cyclase (GGDEF)-like protein